MGFVLVIKGFVVFRGGSMPRTCACMRARMCVGVCARAHVCADPRVCVRGRACGHVRGRVRLRLRGCVRGFDDAASMLLIKGFRGFSVIILILN